MIKAKQERPLPTIKVTEGVPDDSMICKLQQVTMKKKHSPALKSTSQMKKKKSKRAKLKADKLSQTASVILAMKTKST